MKKKLLIRYTKILSTCLVFLGFAGCSSEEDPWKNMRMEYGTPTADYKVTGRIVSAESGKAIPGIRVVFEKYWIDALKNESVYRSDTLFVSSSGKFEFVGNRVTWGSPFRLKVEDVDGLENGYYRSLEKQVTFTSEPEGASGWYNGKFIEDLGDVELMTRDK